MPYKSILKHNKAVYGSFMSLCYGSVCSGYIAAIPGTENQGQTIPKTKAEICIKSLVNFEKK